MSASKLEHEAKEIELKLEFDPSDATTLFAHPLFAMSDATPADEPAPHVTRACKGKTRELISVYYDTDDDALRKAGVFLRVRSNGTGFVQTIKTARSEGEFLERDEWECGLPANAPDLSAAEGTALAPLLSNRVRAALRPRFETRFQRRTYLVAHENAEIELAVDQGEISAGDREAPVCELELELKAGDRAPLFSLAKTLAESVPLTLAVKTKAERGFDLLDGGNRTVEKAQAVGVAPNETCAEAFRIVARNCLRQILVNLPATRRGRAEALHQMRVGLRRLRAAVTLFRDVVDGPQCRAIGGELKWISDELGPARDLDVLIADVLEPHHAAHPNDPGWETIHDQIIQRRGEAYERAIVATGSTRFRLALLDLGAWIEFGDWASGGNRLSRKRIAGYAARKLSQLRRKVEKKGKNLRQLSVSDRHRLRILAKRMRYGSEFFAATFEGRKSAKRCAASLAALGKLLDSLGGLNDIATRQAYWGRGGSRAGALSIPLPEIDSAEQKQLMKAAKRAYARFADVKAFWKE